MFLFFFFLSQRCQNGPPGKNSLVDVYAFNIGIITKKKKKEK